MCPACSPRLERLAWLGKYARVTKRLAESVARLCRVLPVKHTAEFFGLWWDRVRLAEILAAAVALFFVYSDYFSASVLLLRYTLVSWESLMRARYSLTRLFTVFNSPPRTHFLLPQIGLSKRQSFAFSFPSTDSYTSSRVVFPGGAAPRAAN